MNSVVEPPCKKRKTNPFPSTFLSLPDVIILNCLARISKSYYPKLSLVSKTFHSLIVSIELNHARFCHETQEALFSVCLKFPNRPLPNWFSLWIKPDQTDEEKNKSNLVQIPSSYALRAPLFLVTVGSDVYGFRQYYPLSPVVLVRTKDSCIWHRAPNMTVARANSVACVLDEKIYVMGGCEPTESAYWGEVFDTKTQSWNPLPDPGAKLRFSSINRKIEIIRGKIYIRSNEEKDSVYDPIIRKWNVAAKAMMSDNVSMVDNVYYSCDSNRCLWYDTEFKEWRPVKGLSSLNKSCRRGLIETVNYGGKLLILWDKFAKARRNCPDKSICCALVSLEKRQNGQVWGKVEWSNVVLTVPSSYSFLRSQLTLI